jgi:hypothetical protein
MALLNFPPNPNVGDLFTIGTKTYRWSGTAWLVQSATVAATTLTAVTMHITSTANINTASIGTTGALIVDGGASINRDLWVTGNLFLQGTRVLTTASFSNTPADGSDIHIVDLGAAGLQFNNISTLDSVTGRGNSTTNVVKFLNPVESTSTNTGGVILLGGLGVGKRINSESIQIADTVFDSTKTTVNNTIQYLIDTYSLNDYRSSKYFIQIDEGSGPTARFQAVEILLIANNSGAVFATEYGLVKSSVELGTFTKDITGVGGASMVNLYFTPVDSVAKTIKVLRTAMTV